MSPEGTSRGARVGARLALAAAAVALAVVAGMLTWRQLAPSPPAEAAAASAGPSCWLRFELRLLRAAIPDVVGDCVENARRDPTSGDTVQRTTGGLLVLRQADRRAGFTDGARTWVQGPQGVEVRANDERFAWEPDAATATPSAPSAPPAVPAPAAPGPAAAAASAGAPTAPPAPTVPATATPRPIVVAGAGVPPTPRPTAVPAPASDDIMDAVLVGYVRRSGLPLADIRALAAKDDPEGLLARPGGPISRVVFRDQRGPAGEQSMEMFADAAALQVRVANLTKTNQNQHALSSPGSRVLIRLSKSMSPDQLRSYERWLQTLR